MKNISKETIEKVLNSQKLNLNDISDCWKEASYGTWMMRLGKRIIYREMHNQRFSFKKDCNSKAEEISEEKVLKMIEKKIIKKYS